MRLIYIFSMVLLLPVSLPGQTIEQALETYEEDVELAKSVVQEKWQGLLTEALKH